MANEDTEEMTTENVEEDKEQAKGETKNAKQAKKSKGQTEGEKGRPAEEVIVDKSYEGTVKIIIQSPIALNQLNNLTSFLNNVPELRIVLTGGSVREGNRIIIALEQPMPLLGVLSECPAIGELGTRGRDIIVSLKGE